MFAKATRSHRLVAATRAFQQGNHVRPIAWSATALCLGVGFLVTQPTHSLDSINEGTINRSTQPIGSFPAPSHDISKENIQYAREQFIKLLGKDGVNDTPAELKSRGSTEWSPAPTDTTADLIVYPKTTEHVSQIAQLCHQRSIPITPFSGGTSLDGALAATRGGICIDFSRMNKVITIRKDDLDVTLQPAVGWEELNTQLAEQGLFFPVDPGPGAQIGGMIATGCSGTNAYRYGPMKDWVISTTIVLADGTVVKTRNRPRKSTSGFDLTRLIVGSAGTLGLVTEATLKVTNAPQNLQVAVAAFPKTDDAVKTVIKMIQSGVQIEACELLDETAMRASNQSGYLQKEYDEVPTLFMKFSGDAQVPTVKKLAQQHGLVSFESSKDPDTIEELWGARKTALWNLLAQKRENDKLASCDVAVPISQLARIVEETNERIDKAKLVGSCLGHVGDGNFHVTILYGPDEKTKADDIVLWCRRRGIELEGTVTGEHGVGLALRDLVTEELGANATDMMRKIKLALDPKCILSCDKIVRIEEGDDH